MALKTSSSSTFTRFHLMPPANHVRQRAGCSSKWRKLTGYIDTRKLKGKWYCHMNPDSFFARGACSIPEETYRQVPVGGEKDRRLREHIRSWVRRLVAADTAEARLPSARSTRGQKRTASETEWTQCCNPNCGKWRALPRWLPLDQFLENQDHDVWYCVMNTWDEALASCSAPMEIPYSHSPRAPAQAASARSSGHETRGLSG